MLIRIFKANNPVLGFSLFVLGSLLWLPALLSEKEILFQGGAMPLYSILIPSLSSGKILSAILSLLLVLVEAMLLNFIIQKYHLLKNPTYLPALLYVVLMFSVPGLMLCHPVLFSNLFLILALMRGFELSGSGNVSSAVFDSAFFVSLASLFYFPSVLILFFVFVSLGSFRSFSVRDFLIGLVGFWVPYFFAGVYYYWYNQSDYFWKETIIKPIFNSVNTDIDKSKSFYTFLVFLLLLTIYSIPSLLSEMNRNKASIRSGLRLFFLFGILSVLSYFFAPSDSLFHFCMSAIPLSIIFSNMLINSKQIFSEIIFSFLLLLMAIYQLSYF